MDLRERCADGLGVPTAKWGRDPSQEEQFSEEKVVSSQVDQTQ